MLSISGSDLFEKLIKIETRQIHILKQVDQTRTLLEKYSKQLEAHTLRDEKEFVKIGMLFKFIVIIGIITLGTNPEIKSLIHFLI